DDVRRQATRGARHAPLEAREDSRHAMDAGYRSDYRGDGVSRFRGADVQAAHRTIRRAPAAQPETDSAEHDLAAGDESKGDRGLHGRSESRDGAGIALA